MQRQINETGKEESSVEPCTASNEPSSASKPGRPSLPLEPHQDSFLTRQVQQLLELHTSQAVHTCQHVEAISEAKAECANILSLFSSFLEQ